MCIALGLLFILVGVAGCLSGEQSQIPGTDEDETGSDRGEAQRPAAEPLERWTVTEQSELESYLTSKVGEQIGVSPDLLTELHHHEVSVEVHGSGPGSSVTIEAGCGWSATHTVRVHWDDGTSLGTVAPDEDGCVRAANGIQTTRGAPPVPITLPDGPALPEPGTYNLFLFGYDENEEARLEASYVHVSPSLRALSAEGAADGIPAGFGQTLSLDQADELGSDPQEREVEEATVKDDVLAGCGWPSDTEIDLSAQPPPGTVLPDDDHRELYESLGTVTTDGEGCFAALFDGDQSEEASDSGMAQVKATAAGLGNEIAEQAVEVIQVAMEKPTLSVAETDVGPGDPVEFVTCGWVVNHVDVGWHWDTAGYEKQGSVEWGDGVGSCYEGAVTAPNLPQGESYESYELVVNPAGDEEALQKLLSYQGYPPLENLPSPVDVGVHEAVYVALGDSMTSGEGAGVNTHIGKDDGQVYAYPERSGYDGLLEWAVDGKDRAGCHLDEKRAFPARVDELLPYPAYNFGCSGSFISEGLLGSFDPWRYGKGPTMDAQFEQVSDENLHNIEFMTVSTGGNEVNFVDMIQHCVKKTVDQCLEHPIEDADLNYATVYCDTQTTKTEEQCLDQEIKDETGDVRSTWLASVRVEEDYPELQGPTMRDVAAGEEIRFAKNLSYLGEKLKSTFDVPPERILIPSYFDPAGNGGVHSCQQDFLAGRAFEDGTVHELREEVLPRLNRMLHGWAVHEGFTFVPGITPMFQGHGVCDENDPNDSSFRDPTVEKEDDFDGCGHIDSEGFETDAEVLDKLWDRWIVRISEAYNFEPAHGSCGIDNPITGLGQWDEIKDDAGDWPIREAFHPNRYGHQVIAGCVYHEMSQVDSSLPPVEEALVPDVLPEIADAAGRDCPEEDRYGIDVVEADGDLDAAHKELFCDKVEEEEKPYFEGSVYVKEHDEVPPTYPPIPCDATDEEIQAAFDQVYYSDVAPTGEYMDLVPDLTVVETDEEDAAEESWAAEQTEGLAVDTAYVFEDGSLGDGLLAKAHDDWTPSAAFLVGPEGLTEDQRDRLSDQLSPDGEVFVVGEIAETQPDLADEIRAEGFTVTTLGGDDPLATSVAARQDRAGSIPGDADERPGVLATALREGEPHPSTTFASVMLSPANSFLTVPEDATEAELADALAATVGPGRLARGDVTIHEVGPWDIPAANQLAGQDGLWFAFEDDDGDRSPDPGEAVYLCSECLSVTEGDRRIAYDGDAGPGSQVTAEDEDLRQALTLYPGALGYADADGDARLELGSDGDAVMLMPAHGDVRPGSIWLSGPDAGTWVEPGDAVLEAGAHVPVTGGAIPAFVDHAGDRDLGPRDALYLDVDADERVSPGDVDWSGRQVGTMIEEDRQDIGSNLTWAPRVGHDLTVAQIATSDPGGFTEQLLAETGLENVCDGVSHLNLAPVPAAAAEGTPRPTDLHRGFLVSALHGEPLLPVDDGSDASHLAGFLEHAPPEPPDLERRGLLGMVSTAYHDHMNRGAECRPSVDLYELSGSADVDAAADALRPAMEREVWRLT